MASARYDGAFCHRALANGPGEAIGITADVAIEEDVERYLDEAANSFGIIDFHHLNAGIPGSAVRDSGGAGAWDFGALDQRTYLREEHG